MKSSRRHTNPSRHRWNVRTIWGRTKSGKNWSETGFITFSFLSFKVSCTSLSNYQTKNTNRSFYNLHKAVKSKDDCFILGKCCDSRYIVIISCKSIFLFPDLLRSVSRRTTSLASPTSPNWRENLTPKTVPGTYWSWFSKKVWYLSLTVQKVPVNFFFYAIDRKNQKNPTLLAIVGKTHHCRIIKLIIIFYN
jgi:hypothetical protein